MFINHDEKPVDLTVRIDAGADFADLFEVKDALKKKGTYSAEVADDHVRLVYERETYRRETLISATAPGRYDKDGITFDVHLEPHGAVADTARRRHRIARRRAAADAPQVRAG